MIWNGHLDSTLAAQITGGFGKVAAMCALSRSQFLSGGPHVVSLSLK